MTDPKACPFCSGNDIYSPATVTICRACGASSPPRRWNTRPIEDRLRAALKEVSAMVDLGFASGGIWHISNATASDIGTTIRDALKEPE